MQIGIIGIGLIGGSIAKDLYNQIGIEVIGYDASATHCEAAKKLQLVHKIESIDYISEHCEAIIIAVPVDVIARILPSILDKITDNQIVIDVGSTKQKICEVVKNHPRRKRYVAAHPLAGTEFSGPEAAISGLFRNKKNIICARELSDDDAIQTSINIFQSLGMNTYFLEPREHDKHLAYVSHLSHVSSFMLGLTVLDLEKDEKQIFNLASTGLASTVRLAKSSPKTWSPIFENNSKFVEEALENYISHLQNFLQLLKQKNTTASYKLMEEANDIKRVLNGIAAEK
jgi:prephenate dehydrogenase